MKAAIESGPSRRIGGRLWRRVRPPHRRSDHAAIRDAQQANRRWRHATRIRREGPLSIAAFMAIALHDPEGGYYAWHDPLGTAGDFITAPEISQIFGELIGLWCADLWRNIGRPDPVILAELGPEAARCSRIFCAPRRPCPISPGASIYTSSWASPLLRDGSSAAWEAQGRILSRASIAAAREAAAHRERCSSMRCRSASCARPHRVGRAARGARRGRRLVFADGSENLA